MWLYVSTGAAQVDLSGPGYKSVRKQATPSEIFSGFSSTGEIDDKVLSDFKESYDKYTQRVTAVDAFGGDVLSDVSLKINDPATASSTASD